VLQHINSSMSSPAIAWQRLTTIYIPQLQHSCPYRLTTVSLVFIAAKGSESLCSWQFTANYSIGRSVKLLLAFVSTVIPGFSPLEIHDQDFYSLLDAYVFQNYVYTFLLTSSWLSWLHKLNIYCLNDSSCLVLSFTCMFLSYLAPVYVISWAV
jgi:hypothetical protein